MNKSFMDRLFPSSAKPILPQHLQDSRSERPSRISGLSGSVASTNGDRDTIRSSTANLSRPSSKLRATPLSASLYHHDDPFLPIHRAAKALQETIQSLLDAQSMNLGARVGVDTEDVVSAGSLTPTQSTMSENYRAPSVRTVPIRQPVKRRVTLKGARKGLSKSIREFSELRGEELALLEAESKAREDALQKVADLTDRKEMLVSQITTIRQDESAISDAQKLRSEADIVRNEIHELEHRLLELKLKHRRLMSQADQVQDSLDSKISSYENTLRIVEKDAQTFLKSPPVTQAFGNLPSSGMYSLRGERRTLEMAREQWSAEQESISKQMKDVKAEQSALIQGGRMWTDVVSRIQNFEHKLRSQTDLLSQSFLDANRDDAGHIGNDTSSDLVDLVQSLEKDLAQAEDENWNLLVCAIGAELHACYEARELLQPSMKRSSADLLDVTQPGSLHTDPPRPLDHSPTGSDQSNQSLKDTLEAFRDISGHVTNDANGSKPARSTRSESEDDEPPADFLLSR